MPSKVYWKRLSIDFFNNLKNIKKEIIVKIAGHSFIALPEVFSPACSSDTQWFAEKIAPLVRNLSFLEIGTGTGIIACLASLNGASKVVATDINPSAIRNTIINQIRLHLDFSVRTGSVFDPICENELFDIIFWNHPFNYSDEIMFDNDMLGLSLFDFKYEALKKFFQEGKKHLSKNGKLLLGTGNIAKIHLIKQIAKSEGYKISLIEKTNVSAYKTRKAKMDLRIYSFEIKTDKNTFNISEKSRLCNF